jgi:hypothetical protein
MFDRHVLIHAPNFADHEHGGAEEMPESLLSHLCAVRTAQLEDGPPSAAVIARAERCPRLRYPHALTLPLLNLACDGFHACIAFHIPYRPGGAPENTVYWAQARDEREYVLYMLLMMSRLCSSEVLQLMEGAQGLDGFCLAGPTESLTAGLPKFDGVESEAFMWIRREFVDQRLEGQNHVFPALWTVICREGYPMWLPLTEDLLTQRGSAPQLRVL